MLGRRVKTLSLVRIRQISTLRMAAGEDPRPAVENDIMHPDATLDVDPDTEEALGELSAADFRSLSEVCLRALWRGVPKCVRSQPCALVWCMPTTQQLRQRLLTFLTVPALSIPLFCNRVDVALLKHPSFRQLLWAVLFQGGSWGPSFTSRPAADPRTTLVPCEDETAYSTPYGRLVHELQHAPRACLSHMIGVFAHFPSTKASQVQYAALLFVVRVAYRLLRFITHATVTEADLGPAVAAERTVVTDQLWQLLRDCSASLEAVVAEMMATPRRAQAGLSPLDDDTREGVAHARAHLALCYASALPYGSEFPAAGGGGNRDAAMARFCGNTAFVNMHHNTAEALQHDAGRGVHHRRHKSRGTLRAPAKRDAVISSRHNGGLHHSVVSVRRGTGFQEHTLFVEAQALRQHVVARCLDDGVRHKVVCEMHACAFGDRHARPDDIVLTDYVRSDDGVVVESVSRMTCGCVLLCFPLPLCGGTTCVRALTSACVLCRRSSPFVVDMRTLEFQPLRGCVAALPDVATRHVLYTQYFSTHVGPADRAGPYVLSGEQPTTRRGRRLDAKYMRMRCFVHPPRQHCQHFLQRAVTGGSHTALRLTLWSEPPVAEHIAGWPRAVEGGYVLEGTEYTRRVHVDGANCANLGIVNTAIVQLQPGARPVRWVALPFWGVKLLQTVLRWELLGVGHEGVSLASCDSWSQSMSAAEREHGEQCRKLLNRRDGALPTSLCVTEPRLEHGLCVGGCDGARLCMCRYFCPSYDSKAAVVTVLMKTDGEDGALPVFRLLYLFKHREFVEAYQLVEYVARVVGVVVVNRIC